jgi:hypothetical protein
MPDIYSRRLLGCRTTISKARPIYKEAMQCGLDGPEGGETMSEHAEICQQPICSCCGEILLSDEELERGNICNTCFDLAREEQENPYEDHEWCDPHREARLIDLERDKQFYKNLSVYDLTKEELGFIGATRHNRKGLPGYSADLDMEAKHG